MVFVFATFLVRNIRMVSRKELLSLGSIIPHQPNLSNKTEAFGRVFPRLILLGTESKDMNISLFYYWGKTGWAGEGTVQVSH